jgi:hypothetical protein
MSRKTFSTSWVVSLVIVTSLGACGPKMSGGSNNTDATVCGETCPTADALRCNGTMLEHCVSQSADCQEWQVQQNCTSGGQLCDDTGSQPTCVDPETCSDQLLNQDESDVDCGGNICPGCDVGQDCGGDGDCETGVCTAGQCMLCRVGSYACFGNWVRVCGADESSWEDVAHCDAIGGYVCNQHTGACEIVQPIGNDSSNATGDYFQFAYFTLANSAFLGGADVDSAKHYIDVDTWENRIYVNRDGSHVDVYRVELLDSDGDGEIEQNQHPDNPDNPGEIEERVLTLIETHDVPIGGTHNNELYVVGDSIFFTRGLADAGDVFEYDMVGGTVTKIEDAAVGIWNQVLGYDDVHNIWYSAIPYERWVYSYDPVELEWVLEFAYPNLSGDHSDGLEVVTDPKTGIPYVYVSDMTSDFIGQYTRDATGDWVQENLFHYAQTGASDVEGMGFGAFNHFWVTSEGYGSGTHELYEIGGGDIEQYVVD